ncbi:MAG: hypothetical protein ABSH41_30500 [Syntrophobacteraceae bacterium]
MDDRLAAYEEGKKAIRMRKAKKKRTFDSDDLDMDMDMDMALMEVVPATRPVTVSDVAQVGSKVVVGAGLGLLAGVATIALMASMAEIILAGVVTKIAGVVGGGAGLSMGLRQLKSRRETKA